MNKDVTKAFVVYFKVESKDNNKKNLSDNLSECIGSNKKIPLMLE